MREIRCHTIGEMRNVFNSLLIKEEDKVECFFEEDHKTREIGVVVNILRTDSSREEIYFKIDYMSALKNEKILLIKEQFNKSMNLFFNNLFLK